MYMCTREVGEVVSRGFTVHWLWVKAVNGKNGNGNMGNGNNGNGQNGNRK
jgi:hypothetical protein